MLKFDTEIVGTEDALLAALEPYSDERSLATVEKLLERSPEINISEETFIAVFGEVGDKEREAYGLGTRRRGFAVALQRQAWEDVGGYREDEELGGEGASVGE